MEGNDVLQEILARYEGLEGALIPVLHEVQDHFNYIPEDAQVAISKALKIPRSEIYGVITFYSRFTLKPTGKYKVCHCMGTACYVKGAEAVLEATKEHLGLIPGESSEDGLFSLEEAYCVGACGLAPVFTVNEDVYATMTPDRVAGILDTYIAKEERERV